MGRRLMGPGRAADGALVVLGRGYAGEVVREHARYDSYIMMRIVTKDKWTSLTEAEG